MSTEKGGDLTVTRGHLTVTRDVLVACYLGAEVQHIEVLIGEEPGIYKPLSELIIAACGEEPLNGLGAFSLGQMKITFERGLT